MESPRGVDIQVLWSKERLLLRGQKETKTPQGQQQEMAQRNSVLILESILLNSKLDRIHSRIRISYP